METGQLTEHIGRTLRSLRRERGWSLDQLAAAAGVSKPMLGQIERGVSNPTVITLWKIAGGLDVPFSAFLNMPQRHATVVRSTEQPVIYDEDDGYVVRTLLSFSRPTQVEVFRASLLPGCSHVADAHGDRVTEAISVETGCLSLQIGGETHILNEGDSVHFSADVGHTYENLQDVACEYLVWLVYPTSAGWGLG